MQDNIGKSYRNILGDSFGYVTLEGTLPDPLRGQTLDDWVVKGARVSYRGKPRSKDEDAGLIKRLITHQHWSPVEQPQITFSFRAPMAVIVHLLRHRMFHWNGESSRFKQPKDEFYIPRVWRQQSLINKQGSEGGSDIDVSNLMSGNLDKHLKESVVLYELAIQKGVAREQARLFIPTDANYRSYVFTADFRNFLNFVGLRAASDAQEETRRFCCAMYWLVQPMAPITTDVWMKEIASEDVRTNLIGWYRENGDPNEATED